MAVSGGSSSAMSLPPPRPKSPPEYPDLYGKRRELAKVLMLEREIGLLEEEMKYVEGLQPASSSCKEVADFVLANSDPLIPVSHKVRRSHCFWKWLCGKSSSNKSCICCPCPQTTHNRCSNCNLCFCCCKGHTCRCISLPSWRCCFSKISCNCCCSFPCSDSVCCKLRCCCIRPNCPKVRKCLCCTENCCCHNFSSCYY